MFRRLAALVLFGLAGAGGAFAQVFPTCAIDNNFAGAFNGSPGGYTVTVSPNAVGTLRQNCTAPINSYNWSPGNIQTPEILG